jgi:hypothetical protein
MLAVKWLSENAHTSLNNICGQLSDPSKVGLSMLHTTGQQIFDNDGSAKKLKLISIDPRLIQANFHFSF